MKHEIYILTKNVSMINVYPKLNVEKRFGDDEEIRSLFFCFSLSIFSVICVVLHPLNHKHFETPWTVACQAPLSMDFSRQECWSGLPFPSPGDFPRQGIEPSSPALASKFFTTEPPGKP